MGYKNTAIRLIVSVSFLVGGCTSVNVQPVDDNFQGMTIVCIQRNPKVVVTDFLDVLEEGFARHGLKTQVFEGKLPRNCEYRLGYTARRSWDVVPYLSYAELLLVKQKQIIGRATYKHYGGFALNKWAGTRSKMDPVIDELLAQYKNQPRTPILEIQPTAFETAPDRSESVKKKRAKELGIAGWSVTGASTASVYMSDPHGVFVETIGSRSPAEIAGIRRGDIIVAFDGQRVESMDDLNRYTADAAGGSKVTLSVWRNRKIALLNIQF